MSLDDLSATCVLLTKSRFTIYQWNQGYRFEEELQGRITITAFALPSTSTPILQSWYSTVFNAFAHFLPKGCQDLCGHNSRMHFWASWAWVVSDDIWQQEEQRVESGDNDGGHQTVLCEFRRWNGYSGATPEREEESAKNTLAKESWAQRSASVMPPVTAWEQERWDVQLAPRKVEEDEEPEFERNLAAFLDQQLGRDRQPE